MQNKNRVYDKDLRRFIYPQINYEKESNQKYQVTNKNNSCSPNFPKKLNYQYNNINMPSDSYFMNREANRNALGYPRDEGQFSVQRNNNEPFSYISKKYKPESKIYHYSISSKREYSHDIEEDTSSGRPINIDKKTYCIDSSSNRYMKFLIPKKEENILPTKIFVSDTYPYNNKKENIQYKSRPSREKDGYKGGVINLNIKNKYNNQEKLKYIILIQRWWKRFLYHNQNNYERYTTVINRQSISRNNPYKNNINNQGNQFIVQTTRVEVFKTPYINKPLIKPEIITKENKVNFGSKNDEENLEIILDRDSLKQNMVNIWNEEIVLSPNEQISFIQNGNLNRENLLRNAKMRNYEDEIRQLKLTLTKKEKELNDLSNKLKSFQNKNEFDKKLITRQLVDNLFINNQKNILIPNYPSIESNENFEILPLEKSPLKKQLIDNLFIQRNLEHISNNIIPSYFNEDKTIIEARDNIEIIPLEKEPLKKQFIDNLYIKNISPIKPNYKNSIETNESIEIFPLQKTPLQKQFIDSLLIRKQHLIKKENICENIVNIEIAYIEEKKTLEKQLVDELFIEKDNIKPLNIIQNLDTLTIYKTQRPNNIISSEYYFELFPIERPPLQKQFIDDIFIEKTLKPENISQNIDNIYLYEIPKADNFIQARDIIEICSLENEPLQLQFIDDLFIEKTPYTFKNLEMEGFEGITVLKTEKNNLLYQEIDSFIIDSLETKENEIQKTDLMTILKTPRSQNSIEISDIIFIPSKEKVSFQIQELDALYIENKKLIPENQIQNIDTLQLNSKMKEQNIIEQINSINLFSKEKAILINQGLDSIMLESLPKIENEINPIDTLIIEGISYPLNMIQSIDNIKLLEIPKEKNEISENIEIFIPPKEKDILLNQNIDSINIESIPKFENQIQSMEKIYIEKIKKPDLIIQPNDYIYIPKKEKESNQNQNIDSITIESQEKQENIIQSLDKLPLYSISQPEYLIQKSEDLFIEPEQKDPYEFQSVDNLLIEGFLEEENNKMQRIDQFTIIKMFKLSNRIDKMDTIFIPKKEKAQLCSQTVDSIYIEENASQYDFNTYNQIQKMDTINIIRIPKEENKIEKNDEFIIYPEEKKGVLLIQTLAQLMIEKEPKEELINQGIDKIEINEIKNEDKNLDENISLNKFNIEALNYIYIPPKEKEKDSFVNINTDSILIEGFEIQENKIEYKDQINISLNKKFDIENNIISPEEKIELKGTKKQQEIKNENINSILLEGKNNDENITIEKKDEINLFEINHPDNIIEQLEEILITPKEKAELKKQNCDELFIENEPLYENEIQNAECIEILKEEKSFIYEIELLDSFNLQKIEKTPLQFENIDNILFEESIPDKNDKLNSIVQDINITILPEKKLFNLENQLVDELLIDGKEKLPNSIQKLEEIKIPSTKIEKRFSSMLLADAISLEIKSNLKSQLKPKYINQIEQNINLYIEPNEKGPLEYEIMDRMIIEGITVPEYEIQNILEITFEKNFKKKDIKPETIINLIILPKDKEPLQKQLTESFFIEKINNEKSLLNHFNHDELINIENTCNICIEPLIKKKLEMQNTDNLYIERIKLDKLDTLFNQEKEKKENLNLPEKKNAEYEIKKTEDVFIKGININEEYIMELINRNNLEKNKFDLSEENKEKEGKNIMEIKPKIEFVKDRMDSLFFSGVIKKDNNEKEEKEKIKDDKDIKVKEENNKEEIKEDSDKKEQVEQEDKLKDKEKYDEEKEEEKKEEDNEKQKLKAKGIKKEKEEENVPKQEKERKQIEKSEIKEKEKEKEEGEKDQEKIKKEKPQKKIEINENEKQNSKMFINLSENREKDFTIIQNITNIKKEEKPKQLKIENQNIINHTSTLFIQNEKPTLNEKQIQDEKPSLNEKLSQNEIYLLYLEKWKKEKIPQKAIELKFDNKNGKKENILLPSIKEEKQNININISKKIPLIKAQIESFNLDGNDKLYEFKFKQESIIPKDNKHLAFNAPIQPKSEINIHIPKAINAPINKKEIISLVNLIEAKSDSIKLEGNISPEYYQKLILLEKKYSLNKSQIQPYSEIKIFLPKAKTKSSISSKQIKQKKEYSPETKIQVKIKGKEKKPYLIENKGYFIINSSPRPSKNLIVRGSCFGFMAQPKKLGLVSQDFEIPPRSEEKKINWNVSNKNQRSQFFFIKGNNNKMTWNNIIKRQKCVKFKILSNKILNINDLLSTESFYINIQSNKLYEQEVLYNNDFEKNNFNDNNNIKKQKGVVKSTISKIHKEPEFEENQEDYDPFSFCKKRDTTKYDNLFKERKTTSVKMKENNDINSNIIIPGKKMKIKNKDDDGIKIINNKERKSDINLVENKNKNKLKLSNKDNNLPKIFFKKKEKNMEFIRDSGGPKVFFH